MSDAWMDLLHDPDTWRAPRPLPGPIETGRVTVRLYRRGDGPELFRAIDADRASLLPWMIWAQTDYMGEDDAVYFVERVRRRAEKPECTDFPMLIADRTTGEVIGGTGLHRVVPGLREAEIGYWVRGDRQGTGVCTEAVGALITQAFAAQDAGGWGLRRIVIFNAVANPGSRRVCEKLGLRLEMRMRAQRYQGSADEGGLGYHDTLGFAVLSHEWDPARHRALPDIGWPGGGP